MKSKGIDRPFLPEGDVTALVIDGRTSFIIENNLRNMNIHIIKTPLCCELYDGIAYHPDILLHPITSKDIVVAPNVYHQLKESLEDIGLDVVRGESVLKRNYPDNVAYNIARVAQYAIHNLKYTDRHTMKLLEENGVGFIDVKQGYSKCSICIVNDHAIITADRGIAKTVEKYGIEALLISSGYIDLPGLDYGFIGGTCGFLGKNKLGFSGELIHHPDYKRMIDFLIRHGVTPIFLKKEKPIDMGSIIPLLEMV